MDQKFLARIVCHHCGAKFKPDEDVYTISARSYSSEMVNFDTRSIETSVEEDRGLGRRLWVDREINFHVSCWENIAGPEYMP